MHAAAGVRHRHRVVAGPTRQIQICAGGLPAEMMAQALHKVWIGAARDIIMRADVVIERRAGC
jgi:hypothetical protein